LNTSGLSLEQAPPVEVPLRFFLAAPLHLLLAGILIALNPGELGSRWSPAVLASVHLVALGFMTQIMIGSLFQLLPVLSGISLGRLERNSLLPWLSLNLGAPCMGAGFLFGNFSLLAVGAASVALAVLPFIFIALFPLLKRDAPTFTIRGIRFALAVFFLVVCYGLFLVAVLNNWLPSERLTTHVDTHATLALAGWLGLLAMSISFQLTPLFFITGEFPSWFRQGAGIAILALLCLRMTLVLLELDPSIATNLLSLTAMLFSLLFIRLLRKRARKTPDPVVFYWQVSALTLFIASLLLLFGGQGETVAALALIGVGVIMPCGTLLKIIPFLSWLQLQNNQSKLGRFVIRIPHMNSFIDATSPWILLALLILLLPSLAVALRGYSYAGLFSGLLLIACALLQMRIFIGAHTKFRSTNRKIIEIPLKAD